MRRPGASIRVLVVDDSAVVRRILSTELSADPEIEVVGAAANPYDARDLIVALKPDVLTLDIEMPRMDGITFLRRLMHHHPMPVLVISSLAHADGAMATRALRSGAADVMCTPGNAYKLSDMATVLREKVKAVAQARVSTLRDCSAPPLSRLRFPSDAGERIIGIGASTGGPMVLRRVLPAFPKNSPAILIVQHLPEQFTASFAASLDSECALRVKEAEDGERILPGHALIARGSHHLLVGRSGDHYVARVKSGPRVNRHRPSVDVLFKSMAVHVGAAAIGVLMTGMGDDGAAGLKDMRDAGGRTLAQDEASCVVFGMPRAAIRMSAVDQVVPRDEIAQAIMDTLAAGPRVSRR